MNKKLIEVALPLEKINAESAREKSIRHGHPATLHLWWARRPLAAARAVIWASLVDDPSSHPDQFPTEEEQNEERNRLFKILEDLVVWENSNNKEILDVAKAEILKSTNGNPPALLDPFAGGGAIPLEAQRLGLNALAHDLNPVAVTINKAMIEIPALFRDSSPVNPEIRALKGGWKGVQGLVKDVEYYGRLLGRNVFSKVEGLYPLIQNPKEPNNNVTVLAWLWARTIKCPNPLCGAEAPLIHSFILSKRKGKEAYIQPKYEGKRLVTKIIYGKYTSKDDGTINRKGAKCACCGGFIDYHYIREESRNGRMYSRLIAIVAEGKAERIYIEPNIEHEKLALSIPRPEVYPAGELAFYPGHLNTNVYGLNTFDKLFTNRQLYTLSIFTKELRSIEKMIEADAITTGMNNDHIPLEKQGNGAKAYGQAICVYLAFCIDKMVDLSNALNRWEPNAQCPRQLFARQAIPMVWDYAESNLFSHSSGAWEVHINNFLKGAGGDAFNFTRSSSGDADQFDAQSDCVLRNIMISTDPPYYDNIGYADLSDFFYVWMRQNLRGIYPGLFSTMLVPKKEELIANQYRFDGSIKKARDFFEDGMFKACKKMYEYASDDIPVTIYYAYKQTQNDGEINKQKVASTGWETMLTAIINAGFTITGTWPIKTECSSRSISQGANALASSIVLVCRKRSDDVAQITRRSLINLLRRELRPALKKLQESNIAPVDLAQSAIGPGMGVFSRYRKVLEADGTPMNVRSALHIINEEIDLYFNEQVGDLDAMSRFCIELYTQNAFNNIKFGDADILARAKGTSVAALSSHDVVYAKAGTVHLIERTELPEKIDNNETCIWMLTQQLTQAMVTGGVEACAKAIFMMLGSNAEIAKDLAYRLYTIAEQKKWSTEAFAYNALVVAWPDIQSRAAMMKRETPEQLDLFSMGLLNPNS